MRRGGRPWGSGGHGALQRGDLSGLHSQSTVYALGSGPRRLTLRPQAQHDVLRAARAREKAPEFKAEYAIRAGAEGLLSQGGRAFGLTQARIMDID